MFLIVSGNSVEFGRSQFGGYFDLQLFPNRGQILQFNLMIHSPYSSKKQTRDGQRVQESAYSGIFLKARRIGSCSFPFVARMPRL